MKEASVFILLCLIIVSCINEFPETNIQRVNTENKKQENEMILGNSCSYINYVSYKKVYFFNSDIGSEHIIEKIMKFVGLPSNFIIKAANVDNAVATIVQTDSLNLKRFILYNPSFIDSVKLITGNEFSGWSILAHEIGHHLSGHTLGASSENHKQELEADEFSGYIIYKMGATLKQAKSAINNFCSDEGSLSHPPKRERLKAVENGWYNAKNNSQNRIGISGGEVDNILTYQGLIVSMIIQSAKSGENVKQEIIGRKPFLKYIPISKKWQISYKDENGNFTIMELNHIKDTNDGAIMKDNFGTIYSVTNGVNSDGMLFCQLLDIKGDAFAYISFEGLKRK
jgi:hypothetical protein